MLTEFIRYTTRKPFTNGDEVITEMRGMSARGVRPQWQERQIVRTGSAEVFDTEISPWVTVSYSTDRHHYITDAEFHQTSVNDEQWIAPTIYN